jgi:hypothetical protein
MEYLLPEHATPRPARGPSPPRAAAHRTIPSILPSLASMLPPSRAPRRGRDEPERRAPRRPQQDAIARQPAPRGTLHEVVAPWLPKEPGAGGGSHAPAPASRATPTAQSE